MRSRWLGSDDDQNLDSSSTRIAAVSIAVTHFRMHWLNRGYAQFSLWGSLKVGRLYGMRFGTRHQAMDEVIDWLNYYNHRRLHSTLNYISPMKFEQNWLVAQLKKTA